MSSPMSCLKKLNWLNFFAFLFALRRPTRPRSAAILAAAASTRHTVLEITVAQPAANALRPGWLRSGAVIRRATLVVAWIALTLTSVSFAAESALPTSRVVINEIMYHPPEDRDDLQYIELFNPGGAPVDLS